MTTVDRTATIAAAANSRRLCAMISPPSHALDADGAFLVVSLKGDRIGRVERYLVDELTLVEPRNEYDTTRHAVAPACFQPGHRTRVPMLKDTAGDEPIGIGTIRRFRRWFVR